MLNLSSNSLLIVFSIVCALLIVKAQVLGAMTAATRGKLKYFINKEDVDWLGGEHVAIDEERVQRVFRAHRNDLENLLPFFIGGIFYVLYDTSAMAGMTYFCLFLLVRCLHTFAYLHDFASSRLKARLRNATYTVGWLVTVIMAIHVAVVALLQALQR